MNHDYNYYSNEWDRLMVVLKDAQDRGDYHLEMDVLEMLDNLRTQYEDEE